MSSYNQPSIQVRNKSAIESNPRKKMKFNQSTNSQSLSLVDRILQSSKNTQWKYTYSATQNINELKLNEWKNRMADERKDITADLHSLKLDRNRAYPWKYSNYVEKKTKTREMFLPCLRLLNKLMQMREANDFLLEMASDHPYFKEYDSKITEDNRMTFTYIYNALKSDFYESVNDFANDVRLIFDNCWTCFGRNSNHTLSKNANKLSEIFERRMFDISRFKQKSMTIKYEKSGDPISHPLQKQSMQPMIEDIVVNYKKKKEQITQQMKKETETKYIELRNNKMVNHQNIKKQKFMVGLSKRHLISCKIWFDFLVKCNQMSIIEEIIFMQEQSSIEQLIQRGITKFMLDVEKCDNKTQHEIYLKLQASKDILRRKSNNFGRILNLMINRKISDVSSVIDIKRVINDDVLVVDDPYSNENIKKREILKNEIQDKKEIKTISMIKKVDMNIDSEVEESEEFFDPFLIDVNDDTSVIVADDGNTESMNVDQQENKEVNDDENQLHSVAKHQRPAWMDDNDEDGNSVLRSWRLRKANAVQSETNVETVSNANVDEDYSEDDDLFGSESDSDVQSSSGVSEHDRVTHEAYNAGWKENQEEEEPEF